MQITFEVEVDAADRALLGQAVGCDDAELDMRLNGHAKAAFLEHLETYVGRRAFTRGSDLLEHRLALLIVHAFGGVVPEDARVANLFQSTMAASRTLIRNTLSRYRYGLAAAADGSARAMLEAVVWRESEYHARGASPNLVELLNQKLALADPTLKPISRSPDSVATYALARHTYDRLAALYGATPVAAG